jgi:hypothetical protein
MATAHLKGTPRFTYTHPVDGATTHLLALPLSPVREIVPSHRRERHDWWAADLVNREVVTIGGGVREVVCTIRMDNQPVELMEMLRVALEDDVTLTYERTTGGTGFPVRVVEIMGAQGDEIPIEPARARYGGGEWEVAVRLRRTDGGVLDGMFTEVSE